MNIHEKIFQISLSLIDKKNHFVIGLNGMQGTGKTSLGLEIKKYFASNGIKLETISLDDFYLPYADRLKLDQSKYRFRGPPGTHSIDEMIKVLQDFKMKNNFDHILIPIFDKSLHQGQGDRVGYKKLDPETQVILFDGWMQGYQSPSDDDISKQILSKCLVLPNGKDFIGEEFIPLSQYFASQLKNYQNIWDLHDFWIMLKPSNIFLSYYWRLEQEQKLRIEKGQGMSNDEVLQFVTWYWSIMHPNLYLDSVQKKSNLVFIVNEHREFLQI